MKELKTWINVLIVDDDAKYASNQAFVADDHCIALIHCPYWDEAFKLVSENPYDYDAIVLDGKGQINADSETADLNHLKKAHRDLTLLEGRGIAIPYVINTGYVEESAVAYGVELFKKLMDEDKLYRRLRELGENSLAYRMRKTLPDVFPAFSDSLLGKTAEGIFLQIFKTMEEGKSLSPDIRNNLRKILEAFMEAGERIGTFDKRFIRGNNGPTLSLCEIYMNGKEVWIPNKDYPTHKQISTFSRLGSPSVSVSSSDAPTQAPTSMKAIHATSFFQSPSTMPSV
jgi:hypothetical protein